jgi:Acetyltransferase (GNAT) domain
MSGIILRLLTPQDIDAVNHLYNTAYQSNRTHKKFSWEFIDGPAGKAIYVLAEDTSTGKIIGTQCAIPLYVRTTNGEQILTAKSEDTLVDAAYRGQSIFEKMYARLFEECTAQGIKAIWGFTYAIKPFVRIGFEIPFRSDFGLACFNVAKTYTYLASLNPVNSFTNKVKIFGLATLSRIKTLKIGKTIWPFQGYTFNQEPAADLHAMYSSLEGQKYFYLQQDREFMNWRIYQNPYVLSFISFNLIDPAGKKVAHGLCSINSEGIGYLVQLIFDEGLPTPLRQSFVKSMMHEIQKKVGVVRYWGFTHNAYSVKERDVLNSSGFTFTNRGITFVWKVLGDGPHLNPFEMILSRMASQGTS